MSTIALCPCDQIGKPAEVWFCEEHHAYGHGDARLTSVSQVIRTVLPTDYSMVDPAVLENARIRGERIDGYFMTYLSTGNVMTEAGERSDVVERLGRLITWWDKNGWNVTTQKIVHDDRVAGTLDLEVNEEFIIDLKCVSELQPAYKLQLGAYLVLGGYERAAILHCKKDRIRLVEYDGQDCKRQWRAAANWYHVQKELTKGN